MKHVLLVTAYWPPRIDSGTHRWASMAPLLPARGWRPVVLTPTVLLDDTMDRGMEAEVADVETWRVDGDIAARWVSRSRGTSSPVAARADLWPDDLGSRALGFLRRSLVVPDARAPWIGPAVWEALRRGRDRGFDAIISSGPPVSMHLVAGVLAAAWGVPWVADHRDPWFFSSRLAPAGPARAVQRALRAFVERRARHHLVVTQHAERQLRASGIEEVTLIRNGFDHRQRQRAPERGSVLRIAHVGVLHRDRHRAALWEGLQLALDEGRLSRSTVRVDVAGPVAPEVAACWQRLGLDDVVKVWGVVPHAQALALMQGADVLLVLGSRDPLALQQVPAKLYEALASSAFVVGAVPPEGEAAALLRAHGHQVIGDETRSAWCGVFSAVIDAYKRGRRVAPVDDETLQAFDRRELVARLVMCLDERL